MILAIDTATRSASLAVHDGAAVRAEFTWDTSDHHTVELMPRIVEMLAQINVTIDQLSGLGVSIGPGSFTGVRVGVALAKGLAVSRSIPIVGVPLDGHSGPGGELVQAAVGDCGAGRAQSLDRGALYQNPIGVAARRRFLF